MPDWSIGFIGLGSMGGSMAANLARAGYNVTGFDIRSEACDKLVNAGGNAAAGLPELLDGCEVILTCVEGKSYVALADGVLLSAARTNQTFIDHSTVPCPQTRRIGRAFVIKGARYLDAPISGGAAGAAAGTLRIFVGGSKETAAAFWPLFETMGNPDKVVHCGAIGMGQAAKVVQQLTTRLPDVARMEVMAFGMRAGLDLDTLMRALDVTPGSGEPYDRLCTAVRSGDTAGLSGLFSEWKYYLEEAKATGFRMPMLEAMYEFCKNAECKSVDAVGRPEPSIWDELMRWPGENR